ncbi:DUF481 domain-containing protein [Sulfurimonas sp.]|nr:DUF481 domain-containing protein [Sulfurimonas sp.]
MQNVIKVIILVFVLSLSIQAKENRLSTSVALVGMSMDYREYDFSGNILDSEMSGFTDIMGVDMGLQFLLNETSSSYIKLETNLMTIGGYTDYVGSLLGSGQPYGSYVSRTVNNIIDVDINVKMQQKITDSFELQYALGLGYRYWERSLSSTQIEIYEWYSLRTMLGAHYKLSKKLKIGAEIEYQYGFNETMSASNLGSNFDLGGADIMKISIPLVYSYSDKLDFLASAVYEEQTIEHSNVINGFYEPDSTAKNQYIKIGVDFKY